MRKYLAILGGFTASLVLLTAVPAKISGKMSPDRLQLSVPGQQKQQKVKLLPAQKLMPCWTLPAEKWKKSVSGTM